jgi:hypothetical protein
MSRATRLKRSTITNSALASASICLVLSMLCAIGQAQVTTADILGTVSDPSGAVFPNVKIVVTNIGTHDTRTTQSDSAGQYTFTLLTSGQYKLTASASGFRNVLANITLNAGDRRRQDIQMTVGSTVEQVEVSGTPPALETDTSVLSTVVSEKPAQDLPLNGRNFVQLAQLAAGANEGRPEAISNGNRPDDRRQTAAVSANAQSDTLNNELVDGLDNNSYTIGTIGVRPSIDAIAEFRVETNLYPAEIGKTPGAVVNLITKSGTNQLHGSAYEFVRNDMFDARNYFATTGRTPEYRQNQFGGSLGGPIRRDKTFFFGDYEGLRIVQGVTYVSTVPTLFEQQNPGNLSDIGGPVLSQGQLSPIALNYFALYPAPNQPGRVNNFVYSPNSTQFSHTFDVRIDQHLWKQDNLFARYTFNDVTTFTPGSLPPVNGVQPAGSASFPGDAKQRAQQVLLKDVHTFSSTLLFELSAGYGRINNASFPLNYGTTLGNQFGIQNANFNQFSSGLPSVSIAGYTGFGGTSFLPLIDLDNVYQLSGAVTHVRDQHTFKFGSVVLRRDIYNQQSPAGAGSFSFSTTPSSFALANFLTGNVFQVTRQLQLYPRYLSDWEPSFYAQDDWRLKRWLTLNLGLRYDIITPVSEKNGHISHFDPGCACIVVASQNGASSTANIETDYRSVAPRFGFAASLGDGTVLRGGYGLVFFRDNTGPSVPFADPPFTTTYAPNPLTVPWSAPLPIPTSQSLTNLTGGLRGMQLTYRNSYVEQLNFNMEHSFGSTVMMIGYVGSLGRHLRITPDVNLAPPSAVSFITRRPFYSLYPNVTSIFNIMSEGYNNYHGLQASVQRRLSHGFMAMANYTWSHAIGDTQGFSAGGLYTSAVPSQTAILERGNSELDMRHRFTLMLVYQLPFGANLHGWKGALGKGWQFNAIDVWEAGFPFSVVNASPKSNTGVGSDRPNELGNANLDNPSLLRWFDTSMFKAQTLGTIGSEGRNGLYGPHFRHFDFSVFKDFHVSERSVLQARAESFNLTNTPNFSFPAASLGAGGFGTISSTRVGSTPRQLQFALRLTF